MNLEFVIVMVPICCSRILKMRKLRKYNIIMIQPYNKHLLVHIRGTLENYNYYQS